MMKRRLFGLTVLLGLAAFAPAALGAGEGTAVGVAPDALARGLSDRILQAGADISMGETVVTGPSGQVQIIFHDQTRLVVGPNSALLIETYLLADSNTVSQLTVNALGGTFRFMTGNSPKPAYSIRTPTASIAVRGTDFDILVDRNGSRVMLYEGALQICNPSGACEEVTGRCEVGSASAVATRLYVRNDPDRVPLSLQFPYARFQQPLLPDFRVADTVKCTELVEDVDIPAVGTSGGPTPQQPTPQLPPRRQVRVP